MRERSRHDAERTKGGRASLRGWGADWRQHECGGRHSDKMGLGGDGKGQIAAAVVAGAC
jgi:hypothetical protein